MTIAAVAVSLSGKCSVVVQSTQKAPGYKANKQSQTRAGTDSQVQHMTLVPAAPASLEPG